MLILIIRGNVVSHTNIWEIEIVWYQIFKDRMKVFLLLVQVLTQMILERKVLEHGLEYESNI